MKREKPGERENKRIEPRVNDIRSRPPTFWFSLFLSVSPFPRRFSTEGATAEGRAEVPNSSK